MLGLFVIITKAVWSLLLVPCYCHKFYAKVQQNFRISSFFLHNFQKKNDAHFMDIKCKEIKGNQNKESFQLKKTF